MLLTDRMLIFGERHLRTNVVLRPTTALRLRDGRHHPVRRPRDGRNCGTRAARRCLSSACDVGPRRRPRRYARPALRRYSRRRRRIRASLPAWCKGELRTRLPRCRGGRPSGGWGSRRGPPTIGPWSDCSPAAARFSPERAPRVRAPSAERRFSGPRASCSRSSCSRFSTRRDSGSRYAEACGPRRLLDPRPRRGRTPRAVPPRSPHSGRSRNAGGRW